MEERDMIQVAAAIIKDDDKILICQRSKGEFCELLWEFPGGKLEAGETFEECVVRECKEELQIHIVINGIFAETTYRYPDREIAFTFFNARIIGGRPKINVHKDMKWVRPEELAKFEFCPADKGIIENLTTGT